MTEVCKKKLALITFCIIGLVALLAIALVAVRSFSPYDTSTTASLAEQMDSPRVAPSTGDSDSRPHVEDRESVPAVSPTTEHEPDGSDDDCSEGAIGCATCSACGQSDNGGSPATVCCPAQSTPSGQQTAQAPQEKPGKASSNNEGQGQSQGQLVQQPPQAPPQPPQITPGQPPVIPPQELDDWISVSGYDWKQFSPSRSVFEVQVINNWCEAWALFGYINAHRAEQGLQSLIFNQCLADAAMQRASENWVYFSHTRPNGQHFTDFAFGIQSSNLGIRPWTFAAENLATHWGGNSTQIFHQWRNSPAHNNNMLLQDLWGQHLFAGIGYVEAGGSMWAALIVAASPYDVNLNRFAATVQPRGQIRSVVTVPFSRDYYVESVSGNWSLISRSVLNQAFNEVR